MIGCPTDTHTAAANAHAVKRIALVFIDCFAAKLDREMCAEPLLHTHMVFVGSGSGMIRVLRIRIGANGAVRLKRMNLFRNLSGNGRTVIANDQGNEFMERIQQSKSVGAEGWSDRC